MEFQDYTLAYTANNIPINPPARDEVPLIPGNPTVLLQPAVKCPVPANVSVILTPPCPEAISAADVGTFSVNYRNEPIPLRVYRSSYRQVRLWVRQAIWDRSIVPRLPARMPALIFSRLSILH